jgi:hypothetical protein
MSTLESIEIITVPDEDATSADWLEQPEWSDRLEQYRRGEFGFVGIVARATVRLESTGSMLTIDSPGLWGIESDSSPEYFEEIGNEQRGDLAGVLEELGIEHDAVLSDPRGPGDGLGA